MNYKDICKQRGISSLSGANLAGDCLINCNLAIETLTHTNLSGADLRWADLSGTDVRWANLSGADLRSADLSGADLTKANLTNANLTNANLAYTNLSYVKLDGANLTDVNLTGSNLSRADLSGLCLKSAKGIGTKEEEIEFAQELVKLLDEKRGQLEMSEWHTCQTIHCIAGWAFPNEENPEPKASLKYPTLVKYFLASNEEAMEGLRRVASGIESVFDN